MSADPITVRKGMARRARPVGDGCTAQSDDTRRELVRFVGLMLLGNGDELAIWLRAGGDVGIDAIRYARQEAAFVAGIDGGLALERVARNLEAVLRAKGAVAA